jgi:trimethylamine--corrinoid protein Co-methyltransferase
MAFFEFLSVEEVDAIHIAALKILEDVGYLFPVEEALNVLDNAGCDVEHDRQIVRIPSSLVEECISKTPHEFTMYGRDSRFQVKFGSNETTAFGGVFGVNFYDEEKQVS